MNETFFASRKFVEAWCQHYGAGLFHPITLTVEGSGPRRAVHAVATRERTGLIAVEFSPAGFYASPGWQTTLDDRTVDSLLAQLCGWRISKFTWNVRFDHEPLARALSARLQHVTHVKTQVLTLRRDYDQSFRNFNQTIRNQVRKARKSGVLVKLAETEQELTAYYAIHEKLVEAKGGYNFIFPQAFLLSLIQSGKGRLLVATVNDVIVGGGVFLRDGNSIFYLHGAHDRQYSHLHPTCAVIDEAIHWAYEVEAASFNFGGSAGIKSLERFKGFWGAEFAQIWRFAWENPLWAKLRRTGRWLKKS